MVINAPAVNGQLFLELFPFIPVQDHAAAGLVVSPAIGPGDAAPSIAGRNFLPVLVFDLGNPRRLSVRQGHRDVFPIVGSSIDRHTASRYAATL